GGQGIFHLSFAPDGKTLVSSGADGALEVWEVATGKKLRQLAGEPDRRAPLCFSDDGKLLAIADGKTMRVWETADWTERKLPHPRDRKVILPSFVGKRMYVGDEREKNYLWDLASLEKQEVPQDWQPSWTALSPDGKRLAVSSSKAALVVVRGVATGK